MITYKAEDFIIYFNLPVFCINEQGDTLLTECVCVLLSLSYLLLVNNVSYWADHAGGARAKHLFDPLLLQSRAQLAHGQVTFCHLKLILGSMRQQKGPEEMW